MLTNFKTLNPYRINVYSGYLTQYNRTKLSRTVHLQLEEMEQPKEHVSRADLATAAAETNAEAFRRVIKVSNSKIDAKLMISVFQSLGNSGKSKAELNSRKRRGVPNPGVVSVDAVVDQYAKGVLARKGKKERKRTVADYVDSGADLTLEVLKHKLEKKKKRDEIKAREKKQKEGALHLGQKLMRWWVENDEIVDIRYPPLGKMSANLAICSAIVLGIIAMFAWKAFTDHFDL